MEMRLLILGGVLGGVILMAGCESGMSGRGRGGTGTAAREDVDRVLDSLHDAAARSDEARYFALFDPQGMFLGTDATERWTVEEFRVYAHPHFAAGRGWRYTPERRWVQFGVGGRTAWFDELLNNAKLGQCRGSGVLVRAGDGEWRIAQYNLCMMVPNGVAEPVAKMIGEGAAGEKAVDRGEGR